MTNRPDLNDLVRELTERHKHVESFAYRTAGTAYSTIHVTDHPPLLDQLRAATTLLGNADDGIRLGYGSKPSARIDAIDTLIRIEHETSEWAKRPTVEESVRAAASLAPSLRACGHSCRDQKPRCDRTCCRRHRLEHQVRQWWTWARLTTGWDRPAWRPDATCPECSERGSLRIRLDEDQRTATCVECWHTWDEDTIGRLAIHIKAESECTKPGCGERAVRDTLCRTHVAVAFSGARVTVRGLGEVSPPSDPPRVLFGIRTEDHDERERQRRERS